jgi:hypothetical protein
MSSNHRSRSENRLLKVLSTLNEFQAARLRVADKALDQGRGAGSAPVAQR